VAHATREYAVNNPAAFFYQRPFTRAEYDSGKMICDPLKLYDCCRKATADRGGGDHAGACKAPEAAGRLNSRRAQCLAKDQEEMTSFYRPEIARIPEMDLAAGEAYAQCGLSAKDIDAAVIYDAFTRSCSGSWSPGASASTARRATRQRRQPSAGRRLPTNTHGASCPSLHSRRERHRRSGAPRARHIRQPAEEARQSRAGDFGSGVPTAVPSSVEWLRRAVRGEVCTIPGTTLERGSCGAVVRRLKRPADEFPDDREQDAIVDMAARVFADFCTDEKVQQFWSSDAAFDESLWQSLRDGGLTALILPEDLAECSRMTELCAVLECRGGTSPSATVVAPARRGRTGPLCS